MQTYFVKYFSLKLVVYFYALVYSNIRKVRVMKKKYWLLALIIPILLVTGCSEDSTTKSLSCTMKDGIEGTSTSSKMDITFRENEAERISLNISIDYNNEYKDYVDTFKETLETQKTNLEKLGYDVKITSNNSSINLLAVGTNKTLDESEYKGTYDATKKSLEDSGYTCK